MCDSRLFFEILLDPKSNKVLNAHTRSLPLKSYVTLKKSVVNIMVKIMVKIVVRLDIKIGVKIVNFVNIAISVLVVNNTSPRAFIMSIFDISN